jgi:hypothetical protein
VPPREAIFLMALVLTTSAAACLLGWGRRRLPPRALAPAAWRALEVVGSACAWLAINLAAGAAAILIARAAGYFVTIYILNDATLVGLSLLQGLLFTSWRQLAAAGSGRRPAA